jgi:GNAT superfamily N-acetyltransferase
MFDTQTAPAPELCDFVDPNFSRRLEMAETITPECVEALRQSNASSQIAAAQIGGGTAFFGGPNYPANQIVGMGLYGAVTDEDIERVEEFFRSRGVPSTIVVSPLADPSLMSLLAPRGYRIQEFNSVLIRRIRPDEPLFPPAGIEIEPVSAETIKPWAETIAKGFSEFGEISGDVFDGFVRLPRALAFVARIGDRIVGGGGGRVIPEARIAALFGTATLPEFRRQGVQTALIARRLQQASCEGGEYAVVSTLPGSGSQRNMERRGFRLAYTKLVMVRD